MSTEAMSVEDTLKLALEALRSDGYFIHVNAIKALEAALEAHKALAKQEQSTKCVGEPLFKSIIEKHEGLAEELAAVDKEQSVSVGEPVAWISWNRVSGESKLNYHKVSSQHDATLWSHFPLYTTPYVPTGRQQRPSRSDMTWVGLTDEEITALWESRPYFNDFAQVIEAKLKEKNTRNGGCL